MLPVGALIARSITGIACSCFIRLADNLTRSDRARSLNKRFNAKAQKARKCRFRVKTSIRFCFPSEHTNSLTVKTSSHAQRIVFRNSLANHQFSIITDTVRFYAAFCGLALSFATLFQIRNPQSEYSIVQLD